jgi:MFS family permease
MGASVSFSLALILPALAQDLTGLVVALVVLGAALGSLDVSANAEAAARERANGRQIMGKCHGIYSIGAIVGAIAGGLAAHGGASVFTHFLAMGLVLALASLLFMRGIPADEPLQSGEPGEDPRPGALVLPSAALWGLGAVAFCALMVEGAMLDWSAVYLREHVSAGPFMAGAGFALFSAGMAAGRLICDRISEIKGRLFVIRAGALLAAVSMALSLIQTNPAWTIACFVTFGFGLSGILPVMFSIAGSGKAGMSPGAAVAALATTAYTGLLVGPAVIGLVAGVVGLPTSLMMLPALLFLIALAAGFVPLIRSQSEYAESTR